MGTVAPNLADRLPQPKLHAPPMGDDVITGPCLLDALCQTLVTHHPILVSAPVGYGKTTLLSVLPVTFSELPLAWPSFDTHDNNPPRFSDSQQRRNRILLEIRETNLDAQLFFRDSGFRAISVLRDFYDDTTEDAYLMQFRYRPSQEERDAAAGTFRRAG